VISHDEIEMPVLVVIHPRRARTELLRSAQSSFLRYIRKRSVAVVVKEPALPVRRHEKIVVAIVVVITDGYAQTKHLHVESGFVRYVGKRPIVIVVIKLWRAVLLPVSGPIHSVH